MNRHECRDGIRARTARCLAVDEQGRDLIDRPPLEIESLVSDHARRVTVDDHDRFQREFFPPAASDDDDDLDDDLVVDPFELHAPSRRSDRDLARMLDLLDSLPTGNDRKETTR